jgi:nucleotide-binding universal stress UspA family protein
VEGREQVVVCGVDGSPGAQRALEWAVEEATRRGCVLRVVTAWTWDGVEAIGAPSSPAGALDRARHVQDSALARALGAVEAPPEVERVLPRDVPSEALCTAAADAALVVLGSHGHGMVHDRFAGSTTQRVLHHAAVPVVVLPDPRRAEHRHAKVRHPRSESPHVAPMF